MPGPSTDSNPESAPHIWLCQQSGGHTSSLPGWLLPGEQQRLAQRSGTPADEFLASRWLIRQALAVASGRPTAQCRPVNGRPVASEQPPGFQLSLSHSQKLVACATHHQDIGVDIEPGTRQSEWTRVAKRWFSPAEQSWLLRENDPFLFLQVWTLKEAWLKATGRGIAGNLKTLEVHENFELYGDRPDQTWTACSYYLEGFLVTVVYRTNTPGLPSAWPEITLFEPPPDDYSLGPAGALSSAPEPLLHRIIQVKQ